MHRGAQNTVRFGIIGGKTTCRSSFVNTSFHDWVVYTSIASAIAFAHTVELLPKPAERGGPILVSLPQQLSVLPPWSAASAVLQEDAN